MNDNEKRKIDSIIVRIALILGLGFLAVEAGRNVISISSQNSFGSSVCVMQWTGVIRDVTLI
jgi:hypothetical protein